MLIKYSGIVRLQKKFSPLYDRKHFNLIPIKVLGQQAEMYGKVSIFWVIININLISIILFHVLWQV